MKIWPLLVPILFLAFLIGTGCTVKPLDDFSLCLNEKGAFYFLEPDCSVCNSQAAVLGPSFEIISKADCTAERNLCDELNVTKIPTWFINGVFYPGYRSLEELSSLTGCALP